MPPYAFLRQAVSSLVRSCGDTVITPAAAAEWMKGLVGPAPYPYVFWEAYTEPSAVIDQMMNCGWEDDDLVEFLQRVHLDDESYGAPVAGLLLRETLLHPRCSEEAVSIAWDIVLECDTPDVTRRTLRLFGVTPDALQGIGQLGEYQREWSRQLEQHVVRAGIREFLAVHKTAQPDMPLPPNVQSAVQRTNDLMKSFLSEAQQVLPGALSGQLLHSGFRFY